MTKRKETNEQKFARLDRKWLLGKATFSEMMWCRAEMGRRKSK